MSLGEICLEYAGIVSNFARGVPHLVALGRNAVEGKLMPEIR